MPLKQNRKCMYIVPYRLKPMVLMGGLAMDSIRSRSLSKDSCEQRSTAISVVRNREGPKQGKGVVITKQTSTPAC